jgi:DNA repair protein RadC
MVGESCTGVGGARRGHRLADLPSGEQPRERALRFGLSVLSDAEVIALLLRTGTETESALELSRALLAWAGSLHGLASKSLAELIRRKGVGGAKAGSLVAGIELGRRLQSGTSSDHPTLSTPADVARRVIPLLRDRLQEIFLVLVLDAKNGVKVEIELTRGTLNASLVHPREVFKTAIDHLGSSVIVCHNHPSGNPEPSREDIEITRQLAEAGRILGIPLHDHVIVGGNAFRSMAELGFLAS